MLQELRTDDGRTVRVNNENPVRGTHAHFYPVFEHETKYGYVCVECETLDNAMDSMGRLVCNRCGNHTKADDWDAVYL